MNFEDICKNGAEKLRYEFNRKIISGELIKEEADKQYEIAVEDMLDTMCITRRIMQS